MFTGIVEEVGVITQKKISPDGANITIKAKGIFNDLKVNDSISCSGICLTVINVDQDEFKVQLVEETLNRTNAKNWDKGTCINLERSLLPSTRLGGHFVQGHIDDVVKITDIIPNKDSAIWQFSIPKDLNEYIVQKGSICLDGISLTVADKNENYFSVALIPHTLSVTTWSNKNIDDSVNIEVDIMAKYIKSFLGENREIKFN
tara:strand:+ start:2695 stop:3303 length:609 start_codon:yes stop_codon:yes gene_type:complete